MTRKMLIAGIILLVAGFIGRIYSANYTFVDANGILHDTAWLPVSALMLLVGLILLLIAAVLFGIGLLRSRQETSS